jgi:hypothetical protein
MNRNKEEAQAGNNLGDDVYSLRANKLEEPYLPLPMKAPTALGATAYRHSLGTGGFYGFCQHGPQIKELHRAYAVVLSLKLELLHNSHSLS